MHDWAIAWRFRWMPRGKKRPKSDNLTDHHHDLSRGGKPSEIQGSNGIGSSRIGRGTRWKQQQPVICYPSENLPQVNGNPSAHKALLWSTAISESNWLLRPQARAEWPTCEPASNATNRANRAHDCSPSLTDKRDEQNEQRWAELTQLKYIYIELGRVLSPPETRSLLSK